MTVITMNYNIWEPLIGYEKVHRFITITGPSLVLHSDIPEKCPLANDHSELRFQSIQNTKEMYHRVDSGSGWKYVLAWGWL